MARFTIRFFSGDLDLFGDYLTETLTLSWSDEERNGYESILNAVKNSEPLLTDDVVRFDLDSRTAHRIIQNIIADVQELFPYSDEPEGNYYYSRKVSALLHVVSMMMNPFMNEEV